MMTSPPNVLTFCRIFMASIHKKPNIVSKPIAINSHFELLSILKTSFPSWSLKIIQKVKTINPTNSAKLRIYVITFFLSNVFLLKFINGSKRHFLRLRSFSSSEISFLIILIFSSIFKLVTFFMLSAINVPFVEKVAITFLLSSSS